MPPGSSLEIVVTDDLYLSHGMTQLVVSGGREVTIRGSNPKEMTTISVSSLYDDYSRLFRVNESSKLILVGPMTLSGGSTDPQSPATFGGCVLVGNAYMATHNRWYYKGGGEIEATDVQFLNSVAPDSTNPDPNRRPGMGGAVAIYSSGNATFHSTAKGTFKNCIFGANAGRGAGGAMELYGNGSSVVITGSTFSGNRAGDSSNYGGQGGAIFLEKNADAFIEDSTFDRNVAAFGGAIEVIDESTVYIKNTKFEENGELPSSGDIGTVGGALYVSSQSVATLEKVSFLRNKAQTNGEGNALFVKDAGTTVHFADCKSDSFKIFVLQNESFTMDNCDFQADWKKCCDMIKSKEDPAKPTPDGLFTGTNLLLVAVASCMVALSLALAAVGHFRKSRSTAQRHSDLDIFSPLLEDKHDGDCSPNGSPAAGDADDDLLSQLERGGEASPEGGGEEYRLSGEEQQPKRPPSKPRLSKFQRGNGGKGIADSSPRPASDSLSSSFDTAALMAALWKRRSPREDLHKHAWQIPYAQLELHRPIGQGATGMVFSGRYGELPVAIKEMALSQDLDTYREELYAARSEMQILWELRHPNILLFFGASFVRREQAREQMCLVTELCLGALDVYTVPARMERAIARGMPALTPPLMMQLMKETAAGLAFMHSKSVIHRDLKPHNILISCDNHAKIADFGLSKILGQGGTGSEATYTSNVGTPAYMAPELLAVGSTAQYSGAVDIFSFGVILNAMYRQAMPYDEKAFSGVLHLLRAVVEGHRPFVPDHCPKFLSDLMRCCWDPEPEQRITARGVMAKFEELEQRQAESDPPPAY
jgi:serine/threonine protein kinase